MWDSSGPQPQYADYGSLGNEDGIERQLQRQKMMVLLDK